MSHGLIRHLLRFFVGLGGWGLVGLGALDSSLLFLPFGNDLLLVVLTARKPHLFWYYALMATAGSLIGVTITEWVSRKIGEKGLESKLKGKRVERVKAKLEKHAGWALGLAAMIPPPFPFTMFVMAAAAMQVSRRKVLLSVGTGRLARFLIIGLLAVAFGRRIIRMAKSPAVEYFVLALLVISVAGSVLSILGWVRSGRAGRPTGESDRPVPAEAG